MEARELEKLFPAFLEIGDEALREQAERAMLLALRACRLELPKHTFYVDNIFVYQPLPAVKSIYYMDVDLYRYFIGRADQSVNEKVMVTRVDQQVRVTKLMIDSHNLKQLYQTQRKLARYRLHAPRCPL